jgi:hypothetical protein
LRQAARPHHPLLLLPARLHAAAAPLLQLQQRRGLLARHRSPHQSRRLLSWRVLRLLLVLCW